MRNNRDPHYQGSNLPVWIALIVIVLMGWKVGLFDDFLPQTQPSTQVMYPTEHPSAPIQEQPSYVEVFPANPQPTSTLPPSPTVTPVPAQVVAPTSPPVQAQPTPTEWPRPITPEQWNQCLADANANPACADYLEKNGG